MSQIMLDIDAAVLVQAEKSAIKRQILNDSWEEQKIKKDLRRDYSADYSPEFFSLFGAIKDDTFVEPPEIDACYDLPREEM